jgi:membrane-bound lytic murein transglycosylase A
MSRASGRVCGSRLAVAVVAAALIGLPGAAPAAPSARASETAPKKPPAKPPSILRIPDSQLEPLNWADLAGWAEDDHLAAFAAMQRSCAVLIRRAHRAPAKPERADRRRLRAALARVCERAAALGRPSEAEARAFFEDNFRPVQIATLGQQEGFLTGYYEPVVEGSRFPSDEYDVPLYAPPADLLVNGHQPKAGFPNTGKVTQRVGGKIGPPYDRGEIEDGVLAGRGLEVCWIKDPIDAFFLQIQGSARVKLDTGHTLRLNYAGHNGYPYTAIGRILIERGEIPRDEMSMERLRRWMEQHPDEGKELRRQNRSYVFMREAKHTQGDEPIGAQGVELTPGRSIAVDHRLHVYGTLFFISADLPINSSDPTTPFHRLMVAQDTGSAIVGPARADLYFGGGPNAEEVAGRLRHPGRFAMLFPRELDPALVAATIPLPRASPPKPVIEVAANPAVQTTASRKPRNSVPLPKSKPVPASRAP